MAKDDTQVGITGTKRHGRLSTSEARWRAVVESLVHGLIVINEFGIIQELNSAACKLFGYSCEELVGQNVSILMPEPYHSEHDGYLHEYRETGIKRIIGVGREVVAMRKDGQVFPAMLSVGEARDDGPRGFVGVIYDLTEAKQNAERLLDAHKTEAITRLTAGIAHDFNNMLTVIQGNLEMLKDHVEGMDAQELLSDVTGAIEDGSLLVKQLLAVSRKQPLEPKTTDVNKLLRNLLKLIRRTIGEDIEIRDILSAVPAFVEVDPQQLENAILNLVINARDAMPDGGKISIETDVVDAADLVPQAGHDLLADRYARILIRDTGFGIPEDLNGQVFEPFFTTKEPGQGSGLGLSMALGFVRQSGGDLRLDSVPGDGTTVSILLPYLSTDRSKTPDQALGAEARETHPGGHETILLVEDDERVRRANMYRLKALGYDVLQAADGPVALELLKDKQDIRMLFSDIVMPGGMLGNELAEKARRMRPKLKILLTTGYADDVAAQRKAGYALLTKPYNISQLAHKLRSVLDA